MSLILITSAFCTGTNMYLVSESNSICMTWGDVVERFTLIASPVPSIYFPNRSCDEVLRHDLNMECGSLSLAPIAIDFAVGLYLGSVSTETVLDINDKLNYLSQNPITLGTCGSEIFLGNYDVETCVIVHPDNCAKTTNNLIINCDSHLYTDVDMMMRSKELGSSYTDVYERIGLDPKYSLDSMGQSLRSFIELKIRTCEGVKSLFTQGYYVNKSKMYQLLEKLGFRKDCSKCKVGIKSIPQSSIVMEFGEFDGECGCTVTNNGDLVIELNGPICKACTQFACYRYTTYD